MTWKTTAARILFLMIVIWSVATATAQQPPPPSAAQEGFVPVDQLAKPQDTMPAAPLVATAYAFVWVMLFGYVVSIWRRLSTVERELQSVSRRIGTGGRTP
jgi:CcmD family protein